MSVAEGSVAAAQPHMDVLLNASAALADRRAAVAQLKLWVLRAGEQRGWLEVRSANFTIYSDLPQARAVALSEDLELFRAVAQKAMSATSTILNGVRSFRSRRSNS